MKKTRIRREFSAGGVVYKKEGERLLWLVIKPQGSPAWRFPKGGVETNEPSTAAALREVKEETGVEARIIAPLGEIRYWFRHQNRLHFKKVVFYLMTAEAETGVWDQTEVEKIAWLPYHQAKQKLAFVKERQLLTKAYHLTNVGQKVPFNQK